MGIRRFASANAALLLTIGAVSGAGAASVVAAPVQRSSATGNQGATAALVRAAEVQRFQAMLRKDLPTLDALLADDATYIRPSGQRDTKADFIEAVRSGQAVYKIIEPVEQRVRLYGSFAVIDGVVRMSTQYAGNDAATPRNVRYTASYVERADGWKLVAWQASHLARAGAAAPQVAESGPGAAGVSVVERMLIRSAVEELIADYTYCHDRQDAPCVEALMTEDIRITDHMGKSFVGRAEAMRRFNARPAGRLTRHAITNFHIGVTDRDHANATRLMVYFAADENKPRSATPQAVSEYQESYVREPDGRWRISSRVVSNVFDQTGK